MIEDKIRITEEKGKSDRRIRKTQQSIKDALITLLSRKPLSSITIKEICATADINRSTFYAHYADQLQLMDIIENEVMTEFRKNLIEYNFKENDNALVHKLEKILDFVASNQKVCLALIGMHGDKKILKELLADKRSQLFEILQTQKNLDPLLSKYTSIFIIDASASVIFEWLEDGMQKSTKEIANLLQDLIFSGVKGILINSYTSNN